MASFRGQGGSSPGCPCSMPSGCLCSAPFLPLLFLRCLCGLVVVFFPWVSSSTTCVLTYSSGACFPGVVCSVVCLRSRSHLCCRGSVFLLHPCLVRRLSLRRLCFFGAFAMRSPLSGSSVGCGFSHSIGTNVYSVGLVCIPSGWGHPLGQVCFTYTLDHDLRITFSYWFLFLRVGVPCRVLLLTPCFPLVRHHRLSLCYSYLPCVASFCSVGFLFLAFFPCFALLCPWPLVLLLAFLR